MLRRRLNASAKCRNRVLAGYNCLHDDHERALHGHEVHVTIHLRQTCQSGSTMPRLQFGAPSHFSLASMLAVSMTREPAARSR